MSNRQTQPRHKPCPPVRPADGWAPRYQIKVLKLEPGSTNGKLLRVIGRESKTTRESAQKRALKLARKHQPSGHPNFHAVFVEIYDLKYKHGQMPIHRTTAWCDQIRAQVLHTPKTHNQEGTEYE